MKLWALAKVYSETKDEHQANRHRFKYLLQSANASYVESFGQDGVARVSWEAQIAIL